MTAPGGSFQRLTGPAENLNPPPYGGQCSPLALQFDGPGEINYLGTNVPTGFLCGNCCIANKITVTF
jgi:hypothetical protein